MVVGALCAKTSTLAEEGATREDKVREVERTLMPAAVATEGSID